MKNKKAVLHEETIFLVLNIIFLGIIIAFVASSSNNKPEYERIYAKELALMIDEAKPEMTVFFDMSFLEKKADKSVKKEDIVKIDERESKVIVRLGSKGGHSYNYFSDVKITAEIQSDYLVIKIREKTT